MTEETQIQKLIDYFSGFVKEELVKKFGEVKGEGLHQLYERQFRIHYNNYNQMLPDDLAKRHGMNSLFLMAMDDVLLEVKASFSDLKESVLSIYHAMLNDYFEEEMGRLLDSENAWNAFTDWMRKGNETNYNNDYFKAIEVEQDETHFGFDIRRCLYFEVLKEAGRPELGPILCEYDRIIADFIEDWIKFTRYETIASGDKRCTFRYEQRK